MSTATAESVAKPTAPGRRRRTVELADLTPMQQLRAGRMGLRLPQLLVGLWLYGTAMGLMLRAGLGVDPWDVLTAGLQHYVPVSFGTLVIIISFVVLLLWIPLRQWPGLGTLCNSVVIGLATDATLSMVHPTHGWLPSAALMVFAIVLNGLAGALYIGAQLGPGPRDGLMTGISRRTGWSLRLVRSGIELTVLGIGWLLGGPVGVGTVLYALLIGPVVQFFLPLVTVRLPHQPQAD